MTDSEIKNFIDDLAKITIKNKATKQDRLTAFSVIFYSTIHECTTSREGFRDIAMAWMENYISSVYGNEKGKV